MDEKQIKVKPKKQGKGECEMDVESGRLGEPAVCLLISVTLMMMSHW